MGARSNGSDPAAGGPPRIRRGCKDGHEMTAASRHRLDGLEPDNLLAFLALLGLLRALEAADRGCAPQEMIRPRAAWDIDNPPLRPKLLLSRDATRDDIVRFANAGIAALAPANDFGDQRNLEYSRRDCRSLLTQAAHDAAMDRRQHADVL